MQVELADGARPRAAAAGRETLERRARIRAEQRRLTLLNLLLLFGLGAVTTILALRGAIAVLHGLPDPATFLLESAAYVVAFDLYFYVLHRALHAPFVFRRVHVVHHRARDVYLWSTIAMHPVEFLAIVGFVPLALWMAPVHAASVVAVCTFLGASIAFAHSGFEFRRATDRALLRAHYLVPRIHAAHHVHRRCNYGAITTLFDRAGGTLRA
jgi:sterol desaturase/sphingolipid hydroxylase (fatty acid hydroxylase superfamily)